MNQITIGVIGCGRIGKLHAANVIRHLPQFRIKTIADPRIDEVWARSSHIPNISADANEIFHDDEILAVLVCSPSPFHAEHIIAAARAGKHIFCEKPIATDVRQITAALHEVKKAGVKLQVGFNRRFDPNFARIRQLVKQDQIGVPQLLRITSRDPKIPPADFLKSSGGMFIDMTIHDFDMARFLIGSEIEEIYASAGALIDPVFKECDDIDTAVITLKFANGCLGVIDNSRQAVYGYDQRIEVFGSRGAAQADNNRPTNTILSTDAGVMTDKPLYYFLERYEESFVGELRAFYQCIVSQDEPAVSGEDGLKSVIISLAAEQSRRENRPVRIDYDLGSLRHETSMAS
ncbi:Inositol 2-dehydrogenase [Aquicella siphonis]|uniref:Inositol 2-dehydrogenase n=1 Tax=Aquicella siphonis TaxID=254247 RepID=A0A5E4PGJ6_9COXI|nr:inositol 2-dehydrogenase [Aquicella siphonis]VVC75486.1 Inositol 2-dehydrogenase [Aquicella siphonis]